MSAFDVGMAVQLPISVCASALLLNAAPPAKNAAAPNAPPRNTVRRFIFVARTSAKGVLLEVFVTKSSSRSVIGSALRSRLSR